MSLIAAIEAFNDTTTQKITLHPTRDGRVTATLPRVGKDVVVQGNITKTLFVGPKDIALLCEEARLAMAPALALIEAAAAEEFEEPSTNG